MTANFNTPKQRQEIIKNYFGCEVVEKTPVNGHDHSYFWVHDQTILIGFIDTHARYRSKEQGGSYVWCEIFNSRKELKLTLSAND